MSRRFRLYGKKRGARRTGSKRLGNYGEAMFFGVLFLLGAVGFYVLLGEWILDEWWANRRFVAHECVVLDKSIGQDPDSELCRPEIVIDYDVGGEKHTTTTYDVNNVYSYSRAEADAIVAGFQVGTVYRCWYDPTNPTQVVLIRGYSWWMWLLLILPASFMIVGAVGAVLAIVQSGTSAERRAAIASKAAHLDLFDDGTERGIDYPNVPSKSHITNSPGTRLAYRLPVDASPGWQLTGILALCLLWNGIVAWFVGISIRNHLGGEADWLATALLVPFAAMGLGILYYAIRQILAITTLGTTRVEISGHPLYPGQTYEVFVSQTGRRPLNSLQFYLECEEEATYREGTNTRTETDRVYQQRIYRRTHVEMKAGLPFEASCSVAVPAAAMHSFQSLHNEVKWHLVVHGAISRHRDYRRRFPVVVYPPAVRSVPT